MWKVTRSITKKDKSGMSLKSIYDKSLDEATGMFMKSVFALSMLQKVTAKQLASQFSKKTVDKFAEDFNKALNEQAEKVDKALEASLNKGKKK